MLTGLLYNTTYYWKVFVKDQEGTTTASIVWRFTTLPHANTAPNIPTYLYPTDNASWQYPTLNFGWNGTDPQGSSDTLHYALYLGVTTQPPPAPSMTDLSTLREITGLNYATTYYWKVVAHDNHYAYTSGPLYSFTTRDCPWFYKREMPSPRYGFGTAVVNNKIYVIGGTDGVNYLNEVLEYDPLLDTWTRKADMPTARSDLAVAVWNNKIYAIGGQSEVGVFNKNEVYDPLSDVWTTLTPAPEPHCGLMAHAVNGKILTLGGEYTWGSTFGGVLEYNIATNTWWDTTYYNIYTDSINLDSIIWIDTINTPVKSYLPNSNRNSCSAVYNDLIYVMSGRDFSGRLTPYTDIYHPATNTWSSARDMIWPAFYPAAIVANGFIYVIGGYNNNYLRLMRKYDPVSNTWAIRSDLQTGRSLLGAAFINNRIYAVGGVAISPLATLEEYQIELDPKNIVK